MTGVLLFIWFVVTFVCAWFARELNEIDFIGPLGFYMGAQGALVVYVALVWIYCKYMNRLDRECGFSEDEEA
jgi:putative solute:sodium symporter small subunit